MSSARRVRIRRLDHHGLDSEGRPSRLGSRARRRPTHVVVGPACGDMGVPDESWDACFHHRMFHWPHARFGTPAALEGCADSCRAGQIPSVCGLGSAGVLLFLVPAWAGLSGWRPGARGGPRRARVRIRPRAIAHGTWVCGPPDASPFTKPEPCRWTRTPGRTVPLWPDELPEQHSKPRSLAATKKCCGARAWVSVSAASTVVVFSGAVRLGELRSRACRCSRGHRPSGCDTGARGRRVTLPQRHRRGVGGSLTQTPRRRAYRLQRPCSVPIVSA